MARAKPKSKNPVKAEPVRKMQCQLCMDLLPAGSPAARCAAMRRHRERRHATRHGPIRYITVSVEAD